MARPLSTRLLYAARDFRARALFAVLREHCAGEVLDVGGGEFFASVRSRPIPFTHWTTLEVDPHAVPPASDPRQTYVVGDGCALPFPDASFDTALSIQVLEHVFEPIRMVTEIGRVLRPGGKAVFLIPQTSTTHLAPHYHGNFSRYWIAAALARAGLEPVEHRPLGGIWSSMASHQLHFFLQAARFPGMSDPAIRRSGLFWLLLPFQALWALVSLPVCLVLSLGDLQEEPNNHLVVARRASRPTT